MGELTITRRRAYRDMARAYQILIDGENRGEVRPGQSLTLDVDPGPHAVKVAIDWCGSPEVQVQADGAPVRLTCGPNGWNPFAAFMSPGRYVRLERD